MGMHNSSEAPFGSDAMMVSKLLGPAYKTVKFVADNMDALVEFNNVVAGRTIVVKTASYTETAIAGELVIIADSATGFTITLPTAVGNTARITVKKLQLLGQIIVDGLGDQSIDGAHTLTLIDDAIVTVISNGLNWITIS